MQRIRAVGMLPKLNARLKVCLCQSIAQECASSAHRVQCRVVARASVWTDPADPQGPWLVWAPDTTRYRVSTKTNS